VTVGERRARTGKEGDSKQVKVNFAMEEESGEGDCGSNRLRHMNRFAIDSSQIEARLGVTLHFKLNPRSISTFHLRKFDQRAC
jgi:hypothetical protein